MWSYLTVLLHNIKINVLINCLVHLVFHFILYYMEDDKMIHIDDRSSISYLYHVS